MKKIFDEIIASKPNFDQICILLIMADKCYINLQLDSEEYYDIIKRLESMR